MAYKDIIPPAGGKITIAQGKLNVPENPVIPFIRGDGTGPDIWAASVRVFDAAVQKASAGKRKVSWFEVHAGETSFKKFNNWLPDDTVAGVPGIFGRDQRPADHAGGRRHPLAQCRLAPDARPLRLPAARAIFSGRSFACQTSGKGGHDHLPRKHRGHLRRHRIRRRHAGEPKDSGLSGPEFSQGIQEDSLWNQRGLGAVAQAA